MSLPRVLICCLLALVAAVATAATAGPGLAATRWTTLSDTLFRHHTAAEAASANALAQDGSGFLWLGTQGGLARWDGYRFRHYTADPQTPGSLPDNYVLALHVDERGRLWIGTSAGGLARYDAERDRFVVYPAGASGLSDASVTAITGDGEGGLWLGTGAGLDHLDASGAVQRARAAAEALPEGGVRALLRDRSGVLWVGTPHGLLRRNPGAAAFAAVPLQMARGRSPAVARLAQDSAGRVWVGTQGNGAFVIEADKAAAPHAVRESGAVSALQSDRVMAMVEARPGEMWLGIDGGGIVAVDIEHGSTRRIRHHPGLASSLNDDDVLSLYRDRSGLVWVGTSSALSQFDPQQTAVVSVLGAAGRPRGISHANVAAVLAQPGGHIWLGLGDGGIDIIDPVLGRVGQLRPDPAQPFSALPKGRVLALARGRGGEVYIGTQQGLYRSDAAGKHVVRLQVPGRAASAATWALCFDAGVLWIGGLDGLWGLDLRSAGQPRLLRHEAAAGLGDARVTAIARGAGDSLWIGTRVGLAHLDTASGVLDRVPTDAADDSRLPGTYLSSILVDARGRLWVSSFGSGVQLLQRRDADGRLWFKRLGLREGLPHTGVNMLLEDTQGDIWASTDDGLAVIAGNDLTIRGLQRPQGVGIQSYWTNAGAVTAAGDLMFGGQGGLTVVRPDRLTRREHVAAVVVTDARVGNVSLPAGRFNQAPGAAAAIEVTPDERGLWVEFSALDFSAPERNRYAYRLQGFDADWISTEPSRRLASYTNLPAGDYTLQLRGSNRDGAWSPPLSLAVHVRPAWYQAAWLQVLLVLCALVAVAALVQVRTAYLRGRQLELQGLVAARTAELERRSEELRQSKVQLEQLAYADPLTGLPNRRLFNDDLRHLVALASRDGGAFTLLLIDLDGFKAINDTLGHDAGDALLVATAARLRHAVRESDRVARTGGDEFAVLLMQTIEHDLVQTVCGRILDGLAEPLLFKGSRLRVSASIGAAQCPSQGSVPDALYKAADVALYAAKRAGRNTWRWYEPGDAVAARRLGASIDGTTSA